jgi:peptidoglycan/LPS O-acetylase OafA/YrhL
MNTKNPVRERLYHLDLIRFIAALYVVFYHYCFRGFAKDNFSTLQFPLIEDISKYGYLGVDLFFIISGFVILMSAKNSNLVDFCISRFTRLYPAFWFCVIVTAIVVALFGAPIFEVTLPQVLVNLTMFNEFLGVEHVDGVYWSLVVELKFYILIGIILFFRGIKYIRIFAWILLLAAICQMILPFAEAPLLVKIFYFICFASKSPYFVAGMFFFLMKSEKNVIKNILPIIISYFVAIKVAYDGVPHRNIRYADAYDENIIVVLITLFFIVMFLVSINKLTIFNKKIFLYFGVLTYPLYLIHQNIGFIIFNNFGDRINKWVLLSGVLIMMLGVAYLISKYIEKPMGNYMRQKLKENKFLNAIKLKFL